MARAEIVAMGELLIDFVATVAGVSMRDAPGFAKAPGGAPANVAVGARRLGRSSAFVGKVGNDEFGRFLAETLAREGVDTSGVRYDDRARTALAFVALGPEGEREFMFYRHPSADMLLRPDELDMDLVRKARVFHHGSISLINEPVRSATQAAIEAARAAGVLVSYDPNLRLALWPGPDEARLRAAAALATADIVKLSEEELAFLLGAPTPATATAPPPLREAAASLRDMATAADREVGREPVIVVTRGKLGCAVLAGATYLEVPGFEVRPVDTTGAGDAFAAGLLVALLDLFDEGRALERLTPSDWLRALHFANAAGALCTLKRGAIPALPTREEVADFLARAGSSHTETEGGSV